MAREPAVDRRETARVQTAGVFLRPADRGARQDGPLPPRRHTCFDVESAILAGKIVDRQADRASGEWKYLVRGRTVDGAATIAVVVKFGMSGKLVILTLYVE